MTRLRLPSSLTASLLLLEKPVGSSQQKTCEPPRFCSSWQGAPPAASAPTPQAFTSAAKSAAHTPPLETTTLSDTTANLVLHLQRELQTVQISRKRLASRLSALLQDQLQGKCPWQNLPFLGQDAGWAEDAGQAPSCSSHAQQQVQPSTQHYPPQATTLRLSSVEPQVHCLPGSARGERHNSYQPRLPISLSPDARPNSSAAVPQLLSSSDAARGQKRTDKLAHQTRHGAVMGSKPKPPKGPSFPRSRRKRASAMPRSSSSVQPCGSKLEAVVPPEPPHRPARQVFPSPRSLTAAAIVAANRSLLLQSGPPQETPPHDALPAAGTHPSMSTAQPQHTPHLTSHDDAKQAAQRGDPTVDPAPIQLAPSSLADCSASIMSWLQHGSSSSCSGQRPTCAARAGSCLPDTREAEQSGPQSANALPTLARKDEITPELSLIAPSHTLHNSPGEQKGRQSFAAYENSSGEAQTPERCSAHDELRSSADRALRVLATNAAVMAAAAARIERREQAGPGLRRSLQLRESTAASGATHSIPEPSPKMHRQSAEVNTASQDSGALACMEFGLMHPVQLKKSMTTSGMKHSKHQPLTAACLQPVAGSIDTMNPQGSRTLASMESGWLQAAEARQGLPSMPNQENEDTTNSVVGARQSRASASSSPLAQGLHGTPFGQVGSTELAVLSLAHQMGRSLDTAISTCPLRLNPTGALHPPPPPPNTHTHTHHTDQSY